MVQNLKAENNAKEKASTQVKELLVEANSKRVFAVGDTGKTEPVYLDKTPAGTDLHSTGSDDQVLNISTNKDKKKKKRKHPHSSKVAEAAISGTSPKRNIKFNLQLNQTRGKS